MTNEPVNIPPAPGPDGPASPPPLSQDTTSSITPSNDYVAPVADQANPAAPSYVTPPTNFATDGSTTINQETDTSSLTPETNTVVDSPVSTTAPLPPATPPSGFAVPMVNPNLGNSSQSTEGSLPPEPTQLNPVVPAAMDNSFASQPAPDVQPPAMPVITTPEATAPEVAPSTANTQIAEVDQAQTMDSTTVSDNQFPSTPTDSASTV